MRCPFCGEEDTKVIDSRSIEGRKKRRRMCTRCGKRFRPAQRPGEERYGFRQVGTWTFRQAGEMISRLAANNWHIPRGVSVRTYRP